MLGSPILYLKGMRIVMFQLSGFYYRSPKPYNPSSLPRDEPYVISCLLAAIKEAVTLPGPTKYLLKKTFDIPP